MDEESVLLSYCNKNNVQQAFYVVLVSDVCDVGLYKQRYDAD